MRACVRACAHIRVCVCVCFQPKHYHIITQCDNVHYHINVIITLYNVIITLCDNHIITQSRLPLRDDASPYSSHAPDHIQNTRTRTHVRTHGSGVEVLSFEFKVHGYSV